MYPIPYKGHSGSAELDLPCTAAAGLTRDRGIQALPTGICGPFPPDTTGLIIGRSGLTKKGLQVLPGVIDADSQGEMEARVKSETIHTLQPGMRLAPLLLLPCLKIGQSCPKERGRQDWGVKPRGIGSDEDFLQGPLKTSARPADPTHRIDDDPVGWIRGPSLGRNGLKYH